MKDTNRTGGMPTALSDVVYVVVAVAGLPLWVFLLLAYATVVVARQLYWWVRGNTSATSRVLSALARPRTRTSPERAGSPQPGEPVWTPSALNPTATRTP
jgi:hypothetical protein